MSMLKDSWRLSAGGGTCSGARPPGLRAGMVLRLRVWLQRSVRRPKPAGGDVGVPAADRIVWNHAGRVTNQSTRQCETSPLSAIMSGRLYWRRPTVVATVALLAVCCLAGLFAVLPPQAGGARGLLALTKQRLLDKLNAVLLKKTNAKQEEAENSVLQAQESVARAQRGRTTRSAFTASQLAVNACHDGEGCDSAMSPKPKMVYQPSTGNWVVQSAGDPDWIWQHLMQRARSRDQSGRGLRPPLHAAHIRPLRGDTVPIGAPGQKAPVQMLAQLNTNAELNQQTLLLKLKALLRAKTQADERAQPQPAKALMAVQEARNAAQAGITADVANLKAAISRGGYLGRVGDVSDMAEMTRLKARLGQTDELSKICRRRHLAQDGLGVLENESLAGCEREIRAHMRQARDALAVRLVRLRAKEARLKFPRSGSLPQLEVRKEKLAAQLSSMQHEHDELRAKLSQQRERITQLTQHKWGAAMDAANALVGGAVPASTPLADALSGRSRHARTPRRSAAQRRHKPGSRPWSPPVPAGLPPGYTGPLRASGATDVPHAAPPGTTP